MEQERYYTVLARATGIPAETLKAQGSIAGKAKRSDHPLDTNAQRAMRSQAYTTARPRCERLLLQACIQSPAAVLPYLTEYETLFEDAAYKTFCEALVNMQKSGGKPNIMLALSSMEGVNAERIAELVSLAENTGDPGKVAMDCINRIRLMSCEEQLAQMDLSLKDSTLTAENKLELMRQRQELDNLCRQLRESL